MVKEEKNLFIDYGGLIFDYDFNRDTLQRAHKLALGYINSLNDKKICLRGLETAHDKAIRIYLGARNQDNSEWTMNQIMSLMLDNLKINVDVQHLEDIYKFNDHDSIPYSHSKKTLRELKNKYKLGIISNLPHDSLITELGKGGMRGLFDPIVISYQVGVRKPHPKIYQEALRRANTTAKDSIFVSHEDYEVVGAEKVGMRGILVKSLEEVIGVL
ncbi:HAD family hydrolase [Candidatus Pacearchaeota archaeon]|nr:HAD family hydrolase [Candidatus Pacearchaeota archaeon]